MEDSWQVIRCGGGGGNTVDDYHLDRLLAEGWEPFAVTTGLVGYVYHLKLRRSNTKSVTKTTTNRQPPPHDYVMGQ